MKVYILIGLPGSGKSTWSKKFAQENENIVIVNRDAFRTMIKSEYSFNFRYEPFIKELANKSVECALDRGLDVIVDETHVKAARRKEIIKIVRDFETSYGLINTDYGRTKIIYVWFTETNHNLEFRLKENRGYSKDKWNDVINGMKSIFEEPTIDEGYDEIKTINSLNYNFL
jgi:tRNA uridine 5-carbamoylmethylation protein Kti12